MRKITAGMFVSLDGVVEAPDEFERDIASTDHALAAEQQRIDAGIAEHLLRGKVQKDGAKQRLGDADAAQDEVLPSGFQRGTRKQLTPLAV